MLSVMFKIKGVEHYIEVPEKTLVSVDQVTNGTLQIRFEEPFSHEAYSYYSDEVAYIMNSKGSTISTHRVK